MDESVLPPAGWYPVTFDPTLRRWWDGAAWTVHVRTPAPVVTVPSEPAITRRQLREQEGPLTLGTPDTTLSALALLERPDNISSIEYARRAGGYGPASPTAPAPALFATEPVWLGSAQTLPAWFIALSPLWYAGIEVLVTIIGRLVVPNPDPDRPIVVPTIVILGVILVALARVDGSRLHDRGYRPVRPGWALLPIVYLGLRVAQTGSRSAAMLVTYILLQLLLLAVVAVIAVVLVSAALQLR